MAENKTRIGLAHQQNSSDNGEPCEGLVPCGKMTVHDESNSRLCLEDDTAEILSQEQMKAFEQSRGKIPETGKNQQPQDDHLDVETGRECCAATAEAEQCILNSSFSLVARCSTPPVPSGGHTISEDQSHLIFLLYQLEQKRSCLLNELQQERFEDQALLAQKKNTTTHFQEISSTSGLAENKHHNVWSPQVFPGKKMVKRQEVKTDNLHLVGPSLPQTTVSTQENPEDCNDNKVVTNTEEPPTSAMQEQQSENFRSTTQRLVSTFQTVHNSAETNTLNVNESGPVSWNDSSNNLSSIYHGDWPIDRVMWNSGPTNVGDNSSLGAGLNQETSSLMSFSSTASTTPVTARRYPPQQLGTKVEMVYNLLSMLGAQNKEDMSRKLLLMSGSRESCVAMRQTGCLPLLVQLLHGNEKDASSSEQDTNIIRQTVRQTRKQASQALHNIVHSHPDDKRGRREARVLRLLEQIREYCDHLRDIEANIANRSTYEDSNQHPGPAIAALMKLSFDEEHRHAMCQLGGLHAIAELIQVDHEIHGNTSDTYCVTLRRYAGMALTNLTFGDGTNKALLCSKKAFIHALVAQLHSPCEDLRQVTASVLRNLSWRADAISKQTLREAGSVTTLMKAAIEANKESTLKSILSALWNLSAHCSSNKAEICAIDGALAFLVSTLTYKSPSKVLAIIENGGGILRNISSHIAVREDYRIILRKHNCLQILLQHLKSPSLTVVSNACGTLWNLSARCAEDQRALWEMGAVGMLRNLVHSKHKMISMGSSAALKNLLSSKPPGMCLTSSTSSDGSQCRSGTDKMPSLHVRKMRALEAELDQSLSETYDNLDSPKASPTYPSQLDGKFLFDPNSQNSSSPQHFISIPGRMYHSVAGQISTANPVPRSESHDSLGSCQSEPIHRTGRSEDFSPFRKDRFYPVLSGRNSGAQWSEQAHSRTDHIKISHPLENSGQLYNPKSHSFVLSSSGDRVETPVPSVENEIHNVNGRSGPLCAERRTCWEGSPSVTESEPGTSTSCRKIPQYTNLVQKMESVNIEDDSSRDQVIDYSLKYSDENINISVKPPQINQVKDIAKQKREQQVVRPYPTRGSSDTGAAAIKPGGSLQDSSGGERIHCSPHLSPLNVKNSDGSKGVVCKDFSEMNLDSPDQPTDFSQKYRENLEETDSYEEMPPVSPKVKSFRDRRKQPSINDDSLKIYCTEGTPLNFSTASSLTDLHDLPDAESTAVKLPRKVDSESVNQQSVDQDELKKTHKKSIIEEKATLEKKTTVCQNDKEVKTVTFGEKVNYAEETPLMFSRSSSLGSLSSFDQHSIQDDRSSIVSDFSRRASEVVSPSELPDSPSQTMPSTPPPATKPAVFNFPNKHVIPCSETITFSKPTFSSACNIPSTFQQNQQEEDEVSTEKDVKTFAVEGTPAEFSRATSLSSLTIDDSLPASRQEPREEQITETIGNSCKSAESITKNFIITPQQSPDETFDYQDLASAEEKKEKCDDEDTCEVSEEDILAACISSGMPNNNSLNCRNNTRLHSRMNNLGTSVSQPKLSNIPIKSTNARLSHHVANIPKPLVPSGAAQSLEKTSDKTTNLYSAQQRFGEDSFKVYNTEDTPLNLSHATSLSDISGISAVCDSDKKSSHSLNLSNSDNQSDSSALCDDNDNILLQCIQSGMPTPQPSLSSTAVSSVSVESSPTRAKSKLPHILVKNLKSSYITKPQASSSEMIHQVSHPIPPKSVKPKHSHCCLNNRPHVDRNEEKHTFPYSSHSPKRSSVKPSKNSESYSESHTKSPFCDSPRVYMVEGTPVTFSRNESLSSLSTEECEVDKVVNDSDTQHDKSDLAGTARPVDRMPKLSSKSIIPVSLKQKSSTSEIIPVTNNLEPHSLLISKEKQEIRDGVPQSTTKQNCILPSKKSSDIQEVHQELKTTFHVEGTPVCFSRNSSLSSLSVESFEETSCSEQALLDACITSGMPKDKSVNNRSDRGFKSSLHSVENRGHKTSKNYKEEKHKKTEQNIKEMQCKKDEKETSTMDEKGKEDEYAQEKEQSDIPSQTTLNNVYGVTKVEKNNIFQEQRKTDILKVEACLNILENSTDFQSEAQKIVEKVEAEVQDDLTQSSISCMSDLDNAKPPSIFIDLGSLSMASSGFSDIVPSCSRNGDLAKEDFTMNNKGSKKHKIRNMPETVRRALCVNSDASKTQAYIESGQNKMALLTDSSDSLSMKGSTISEVLENVDPPSFMDMSLTGSCTSLNSISSDVLENRSQSTNEVYCTKESSIFDRLNAAASVAQVYSRELNTIMTGSMKSSCNSEIIDHVKPPSFYQDIAEVTAEDITEFECDNIVSDIELDDDLPKDDMDTHVLSTETLKAPQLHSLQDEQDGSTENLTYVLDECESMSLDKETLVDDSSDQKLNSDHSISKVEAEALKVNATLVVCTLNEMQDGQVTVDEVEFQDNMLEDETLSLVSNDSEEELDANDKEPLEHTVLKGPRIIRPINKETIRQMKEKKVIMSQQKLPKVTKTLLPAKSPRAVCSSSNIEKDSNCSLLAKPTSTTSPSVRPTRTSALRATQKNGLQSSPEPPFLPTKTNLIQTLSNPEQAKNCFSKEPNEEESTVQKDLKTISSTTQENEAKKECQPDAEVPKPRPLVKQGTFTKEKPTQNAPQISPTSSTNEPQVASSKPETLDNTNRCQWKGTRSQETSKTKEEGTCKYASSSLDKQIQSSGSSRTKSVAKSNVNKQSVNRPVGSKSFVSRSSSASSRYSRSTLSTYSTSNGSLSSSSSSGTLSLHTNVPRKGREATSKIASIWKKTDVGVKPAERKNSLGSRNSSWSSSRQKYERSPSFPCRTQSSGSMIPTTPALSKSSTYEKLSSENKPVSYSPEPAAGGSRKNQNMQSAFLSGNIKTPSKLKTSFQTSSMNSSDEVTHQQIVTEGTKVKSTSGGSFLRRLSRQQTTNLPICKGGEEQTGNVGEKSVKSPFYSPPNSPHHSRSLGVSLLPTRVGRKVSDIDQRHQGFSSHSDSTAGPTSAVVPPFNYIPSPTRVAQQRSVPEKIQQNSNTTKKVTSQKNSVLNVEKEPVVGDKCRIVTAV
ncbi:adenomatous polyposis coli protein-like isoform X2 [Limulus polyphemus]|uniref:Adenomatous polyposis coli protein-like isoform X2 n=1 Tax=Limulus polyphemus TaxID=6850 RepID=A0ABM1T1U6_LIMPO|nr:adenomatous polyposis coli protein-like isoform X2 [Limulus polyphemus]